jgi:succinylglutamic semialdehyde dehydrogenase
MNKQPGIFTNQKWEKGAGESFSSFDPSTGDPVWQGQAAGQLQIDEVVKNANNAFDSWASLGLNERYAYLENFASLLKENQDKMAQTISMEMGKPLWEAKTEVTIMINKISLSKEAYESRCGIILKDQQAVRSITRHKPHGAVAVFGPFNFPAHLPNGHIIPALLAGNTVIFKPSDLTPLVAQETMTLWEQAKLPPGVINMVQGGRVTGQFLAQHPILQGIFFTGSYPTGKAFSEQFGSHPEKILALEMGGNNPLVVTHTEDNEAAAYLTIQSSFLTSGQRCTCARRLIVPLGSKGDQFIAVLINLIKKIKVGPYTDDPEPFMGPLVSAKHAEQVLDAQQKLLEKGAKPLVLMQLQDKALLSPGLIDVTDVAERPDQEIFGPLLQLIRVSSFKKAVQEANNTKYGLSAGLISTKSDEYSYFYDHIKAGLINWNTPTTGASSAAPFGGVGCSGNHRPSAFFAADYCSYPVASLESPLIKMPDSLTPGIGLTEG